MHPFTYSPPTLPLVILHQDKDLLVIDKPAGLLSVPGRGAELRDSAWSRALATAPLCQVVHRLDMATSGVLLFALRRKAEATMRAQFHDRTVEKWYLARVLGRLAPTEGTIELPLAADPMNSPLQRVEVGGRPALTRWKVLQQEQDSTLVELRPLTGRSHQLRVHMAALGHPILGDALYGPGIAFAAAPRLLLHAAALSVTHPYSGERLTFTSAVPFA
ncbi:MAG: RluA family pseudouridine synthase [Myxococcales bacterium]|nr:RluA family pseudouridine synthase [Myxococcales bacterium]